MDALFALLLVMVFVVGGHGLLAAIVTRLEVERLDLAARRRWERFEWRDDTGQLQEGHRRVKLAPPRERFAAYRPEWSEEGEQPAEPFAGYEPGQWR
jgi:hypothetical protein